MLLLYLFLFLKASVNKNYKICIPPQYNRGGGGISFVALTAQKKKDSRRNPVQQRGSQQCGGAAEKPAVQSKWVRDSKSGAN